LNISAEYLSAHFKLAPPKTLNKTIFLMKNWQWMGVIGILIVGVIAQWFLQLTFRKTILNRIQDKLTESQQNPKFVSVTLLSMGLSWFLLLPMLNLEPEVFGILRNGSALLAMVSAIFVISRALDIIKNVLIAKAHKTDNKVDDVLIPMFHKVIKLAVFVIGIILIASNIGIDVNSLLAGLGIAGMAFALAAKDTVENIFGSVTVLTDKPFEVGDWVVINGVEGTVEQIGLRSTRIRTFYCSQVNVPNSTLIKAVVDNYGRRTFRRIKTYLSLTYDTPAEKIEAFCEGIRELIRNHPHTRKDYYQVYFNQFNAASLDVLLYCYIDTEDWAIELRERQRLFLDIKRLAARLEIEFAFPTQTIHMANSEDLYPPVKETSLDAITAAYETGKRDASQLLHETANTSKTPFPKAINYDKGTPYIETGK
ncbi:MAG: mechanosensitive ion channel family protein, partial [Lentisphaeraceae bacterium]|nr:mechanosensitive ion channel family protein [Lentisphaeraceae bacterium]